MLSEERQSKILNLVLERKSMTLQQLMDEIGTSESTIRRDLSELDAKGLLEKVYGGAIAKKAVFDLKDESVTERKEQHYSEKIAIAKYAASLIQPGDFVFLDAGTTTELMINFIEAKGAVFVTNAFLHAKKLSEAGFKTYILAGEIKLPTEAVVGEEAVLSLQKYHFTKGFWGTNAVNLDGFSTPDVSEAMVKRVSMQRCQNRYVLADGSKFSKISCVNFGAFEDSSVITAGLSEDSENSSYRKYQNVIEVEVAK